MCTGLELIALAGTAASTVGGMITQKEQQANIERQAKARNDKLNSTMLKNDALAKQSRADFDARQKNATGDAIEQDRADKTQQRTQDLTAAVDSTPAAADVSLSGSAPTVIKSELAKRMASALGQATDSAKAQAKLGGYGDAWLNQGFQDVDASRDIGTNANYAAGNMAILPYQQDIAEQHATKPISPLGSLLQGFGSIASSYGGGGGAVPKKSYTSAIPKAGYLP
ncbi:hypothetical protein [Mesorhizobium sp. M0139]|uniref:hypothetical protein n=1 Tax=Mesorhizobium sp. M0139 TaxID=2956892 RepID=UPI00333536A1